MAVSAISASIGRGTASSVLMAPSISRLSRAIAFALPVLAGLTSVQLNVGGARIAVFELAIVALVGLNLRRFRIDKAAAPLLIVCVLAGIDLAAGGDIGLAVNNFGGLFVGVLTLKAIPTLELPLIAMARGWVLGATVQASLSIAQILDGAPRAAGGHRFFNELAIYGVCGLVVAFMPKVHRALGTPAAVVLGVSSIASVLASGGRAGFGSIVLIFTIHFLTQLRRPTRAILLLTVSVSLMYFAVPKIGALEVSPIERIESTSVGTEGFHTGNWARGLELVRGSPVGGVGTGNAIVRSSIGKNEYIIHSTPIGVLSSWGLIGVIALAGIFASSPLMRCRRESFVVALGLSPLLLYLYVLNSRAFWLTLAVLALSHNANNSRRD